MFTITTALFCLSIFTTANARKTERTDIGKPYDGFYFGDAYKAFNVWVKNAGANETATFENWQPLINRHYWLNTYYWRDMPVELIIKPKSGYGRYYLWKFEIKDQMVIETVKDITRFGEIQFIHRVCTTIIPLTTGNQNMYYKHLFKVAKTKTGKRYITMNIVFQNYVGSISTLIKSQWRGALVDKYYLDDALNYKSKRRNSSTVHSNGAVLFLVCVSALLMF